MGKIALECGEFIDASVAAKRASEACKDYLKKIEKDILSKIENLPGKSSDHIFCASFFAKKEIENLSGKSECYMDFSKQVRETRQYIKEHDRFVSKQLTEEGRAFRESHGMKQQVVHEWIKRITVGVKNKTKLGTWISELQRKKDMWIDDKIRDVKRWFELDGGKYILRSVSAGVTAAVGTAALIFSAFPAMAAATGTLAVTIGTGAVTGGTIWMTALAAAGVISAVTAVVDQVVECCSHKKAYAENNQNPAWAKRTDETDSVSDYMRNTLFESPEMNKQSYQLANAYDTVGLVADTMDLTGKVQNANEMIMNLKAQKPSAVFRIGKVYDEASKPNLKQIFQGICENGKKVESQVEPIKGTLPVKIFEKVNNINHIFDKSIVGMEQAIHTDALGGIRKGVLEYTKEKLPLWDYAHKSHEQLKNMLTRR